MERIVDLILSDIEAEPRRARWAGYFDLARALAVNAILTSPRAWIGNDAAFLGRLVLLSALFGVVTAVVWNLGTIALVLRRGLPGADWILWLLPSVLTLTMPAAILIAVPVALRDRFPDGPLITRALALALLYSVVLFVFVGWIVPASNQSYRAAVLGRPLPPGANERSLPELRRDIANLGTFQGGEKAVRRLEFIYQSRLANVLTPVSVMLLALALGTRTKTKQHPYRSGLLALLLYTVFFGFTRGWITVSLNRASMSPLVLAWAPQVMLAVFGTLALYFSAIATPAKPWTALPPPGSSNDPTS